jgi:hypothetical protein
VKRSIALAILLFTPLLIGLVDQMGAFGVPVTRTLTFTTTMTTTMTDVETTTFYWTLSEESTVATTRTTTYTTTGTLHLPFWKATTTTVTQTSTKYYWTTTTKLTTKTTTITVKIPFPGGTITIVGTSTYPTTVNVWTLKSTTVTSASTRTTSYLSSLPILISGTVTTQYPTETLTTVVSTSVSAATVIDVGTQTFTQTMTIPYVTDEAPPPSKLCIIATAAHDSELAPDVQFLREFRDSVVMSTRSGTDFMTAFNRWYYSFSPGVAKAISENLIAKNAVRTTLQPLIGVLRVATGIQSHLGFNAELAIVLVGIMAASLLGLIYIFPPMLLASILVRSRRRNRD